MYRKLTAILAMTLLMATAAIAAPVPDTGQTGDYTATRGEDSDYEINPHSYTDIGNGIVRDNVTGLEWVQDGNLIATRDPDFDTDGTTGDGAVTWQHALDYIDKLNNETYLGCDEWRLPTVKELSTLVDASIPSPGPTIDTSVFPGTVASHYWSSTTNAGLTDRAWYVYFYCGYEGSLNKAYSMYVRAVRGGQPEPEDRFVDNDDGTVTDTSTGLMWQLATASGTYTWEQALTYCEGLSLGGYSDWRLPTRNELQSIVDYDVNNPSIDTSVFPDTVASHYWSSTTYVFDTGGAWYVLFRYGYVHYGNKASSLYVRAVRSGQCGYFGDSDLDGICDDGDASGVPGDNPCTGGNTVFCDDNCPGVNNVNQIDADSDGIGDVCDPDDDNDGICDAGLFSFTDYFSDGSLSEWTGYSGTWEVSNGELVQNSEQRGQIVAGSLSWKNYVFSADAIVPPEGSVGIMVRVQDSDNMSTLIVSKNSAALHEKVNSEITLLNEITPDIHINSKVNLKIIVQDDGLNAYIDDIRIFNESLELREGMIGLVADAQGRFDNIKVVDIEPLKQGETCSGSDNCNYAGNASQSDNDMDGIGDVCDPDDDNDGVCDPGVVDAACSGSDNCPDTANVYQVDTDGDGIGNTCDNCPQVDNPEQNDFDNDGVGDACDPDDDNDGICDPGVTDPQCSGSDACLCDEVYCYTSDGYLNDSDGDNITDECDNCPDEPNGAYWGTCITGSIGDACRVDRDCGNGGNCSLHQADKDQDGVGDVCDNDRDGDGKTNDEDVCPDAPDSEFIDSDADGVPDACDNCVHLYNPQQADEDSDGRGNVCDILPDTGQYKYYDNEKVLPSAPHPGQDYFAQDAQYSRFKPSYTKLNALGEPLPDNATAWALTLDDVTGLVWEIRQDNSKFCLYTLAEAEDYIDRLNAEKFGGFNDWRLPTTMDLLSIVHRQKTAPAVNRTYFPDTQSSLYWADYGRSVFDLLNIHWNVSFATGYTAVILQNVEPESTDQGYYYVRPVRGNAHNRDTYSITVEPDCIPGTGFDCDGIITDNSTGLEWTQKTKGDGNWKEALATCSELILNNDGEWTFATANDSGVKYDDWRLPNVIEMYSIVRQSVFSPNLDEPLLSNKFNVSQGLNDFGAIYWTSTSVDAKPETAWILQITNAELFEATSSENPDSPKTGRTASCLCVRYMDGYENVVTLVELSDFDAAPGFNRVILTWTTASEVDNAGFNLYRSDSEDGDYVQINDSLIPAEGSATQGAEYEFIDTDVRNRKTYWYKLEDIDLNGTTTMHGPVSATPRLIFGGR